MPTRIGIIAASSAVPMVELEMGLDRLRCSGFEVRVHPHVGEQHFTFAGTDQQRFATIVDFAWAGDIDVLWCARGGYGATRLLPLLAQHTRLHGPPPKKLLVGYSDVTVLHEFVRNAWGWDTLHATMPGALNFFEISPEDWQATVNLVGGQPQAVRFSGLRFLADPPPRPLDAELVGGNLTLWCCLAGTPWAPSAVGRILFFEDIGEAWYRIDRMLVQMEQAGLLLGARAIVLGDFTDCRDEQHMVRQDRNSDRKVPLRRLYGDNEAMDEIFGTFSRRLRIPIAVGLPVGHGPHFAPLPLGRTYVLSPDGALWLK